MKKQFFLTLMLSVFCLSLTIVSYGQTASKNEAEVTFVTAMTCNGCKKGVETKLSEATGVIEFTADVPTKEVWVKYDPQKTNVAKLIEVINKGAVVKAPPAEVTFTASFCCGSCLKKIDAKLAEAKGVLEFKGNVETKEIWVKYEPQKIDVAQLIETIGSSAAVKGETDK